MIKPHGGSLINKIVGKQNIDLLQNKIQGLKTLIIEDRYISDCEMIANGGFSPLTGFMIKSQVEQVINFMELDTGLLWSIPIVLPVDKNFTSNLEIDEEIVLYSKKNIPVSLMKIKDKYTLDLDIYCEKVYKTIDIKHPGVEVIKSHGNNFIGGEITLLNRPERESISGSYYLEPNETRLYFQKMGWQTVVAFQTRNPIHRAHEYLIKCALESVDGALIHPLVGETKSDDIPSDIRMKCYEVLVDKYFNKSNILLSVLPASMRYAGPREAIHHMIMRKNYGCSHMIIGRDHAGVGDYYGTYEAQELVEIYLEKLEIKPVKFEHSFYCKITKSMATTKTSPSKHEERIILSGTKVREMLKDGIRPPEEFTRHEVADILIEWAKNKS